MAILNGKQIGTFQLADNTTASGNWTAGNQSFNSTALSDFLFSGFTTGGLTSTLSSPGITQMDTNTFVAVYGDNTQTIISVPFSVAGNVISVGTPVTSSSFTARHPRITKLTTTTALLTYDNQSTEVMHGRVLTLTGLSISLGTETSLGFQSPGTSAPSLIAMNATEVLTVNGRQSAAFIDARIITISGTTIAAVGSPGSIAASNTTLSCTKVDTTTALMVYNSSGAEARCVTISISGTTCTFNTFGVVNAATGYTSTNVTMLTPTKAVGVGTVGSDGFIFIITLIGVNVAATAPVNISTFTGITSIFPRLAMLRLDKVLITFRNNATNSFNYVILNVSGTSFITHNAAQLSATPTFGINTVMLPVSSSRVIHFGQSTTTFFSIIESVDI